MINDTRVSVPGGEVFVREWRNGATNNHPLVLLHDSLGCVELWREFPALLAETTHRRVIAYDRLGFGQSTQRTDRPSVTFIDDEAEVYFPAIQRALGFQHFSLFGHSVGGAMALRIAAALPNECVAVITEAAQCFVEDRTLQGIREAQVTFADPAQLKKLEKWHGEKTRWVLDAWIKTWLSPQFATWSLEPQLGKVRSPVLAIHGDQDEYGSEAFPRRIVERVSGPSQLAILKDCGHVPHRQRQEDVLRLTSIFLQTAS